jgi:acylphosphatase
LTEKKRAHVYVSGGVQGVFYRSNTKKTADKLGLSGWVRNMPDGRVEAVFEGDSNAVDEAIAWCWKGPEHACVDDVEVWWEAPDGKERLFEIKY